MPSDGLRILKGAPMSRFLQPAPESIISVKSTDDIPCALRKLVDKSISAVPVFDANEAGKCLGFVDFVDVVSAVSRLVDDRAKMQSFYSTVADDKNVFKGKLLKVVINQSHRNPFVPVTTNNTFGDVLQLMGPSGLHRVPVVDERGSTVNIVTQSAVVSFLAANIDSLGDVADKTLEELGLGLQRVISVYEDTPALDAFRLMDFSRVSCVGVIDDDGKLVTTVSAKDLRLALSPGGDGVVYDNLNVGSFAFAQKIRQEDLNTRVPSITCTPTTTLRAAIGKLDATKVHRVFVVDAEHRPVGVVALRDVIMALLRA